MIRLRAPLALLGAAVLALTFALTAWGERLPSFGTPPLLLPRTDSGSPELVLRAEAVGLVPGLRSRLHVTVRNPGRRAVRVVWLGVYIGAPARGCPARALRAGRLRRPLRVPARGQARTWVAVSLQADAPRACSDRRFPLRLRALAVGA